jgi:hypothetical protein
MPGSNKRLYNWFFVVFIIALTVFKWNDFHLPYFLAAELDVYGRAANYQVEHGISLLPASVPPIFSRGHPLLFTFMNACVLKIFGNTVLVAHLFCFSISLLLLVSVYLKISKYFDPLTGLLAALILGIQPVFLAQCGLLVPEIALSLFIFLALCAYYERRYLLFAIYCPIAVFIKETGVLVPVAALAYDAFGIFFLKLKPDKSWYAKLIAISAVYLIFAAFLLIQKQQNAWYFFPYHLDLLKGAGHSFVKEMIYYGWFILVGQGRYILTAILVCAIAFAIVKNQISLRTAVEGFLLPANLLGVIYFVFIASFGYYVFRYTMPVMVIYCIICAFAITQFTRNSVAVLFTVLVLVFFSYKNLDAGNFKWDSDLGYRRQINVAQEAVNYVYDRIKPEEDVEGPCRSAFYFSTSGYLGGRPWNKRQYHDTDNYYLILCTPGTAYGIDSIKNRMSFLKNFDDGYAHASIYWVKNH